MTEGRSFPKKATHTSERGGRKSFSLSFRGVDDFYQGLVLGKKIEERERLLEMP